MESNAALQRCRVPMLLALLLVSANLLAWEILLTRIYSTMLFYHFAFMAVSVAMFGLTVGATAAFLWPVNAAQIPRQLGWSAALVGISSVAAISIQLNLPLQFESGYVAPTAYLVWTYLLSAAPFVPGGYFICVILTRFEGVGRLYAADLIGAGAACALFPVCISAFNGPGAVLATAALSCIAAALVRSEQTNAARADKEIAKAESAWLKRLFRGSWHYASTHKFARSMWVLGLLLVVAACLNVSLQWLRVRYRHDGPIKQPLYETWNAFSRVMVNPYYTDVPFRWSINAASVVQSPPLKQLWLEIDSGAGTPITNFSGDFSPLEFMRYDLPELAYHLRQGDACIIGPGGGRDVLAALTHGCKSVLAVEVNPSIVSIVNKVYGDFSGHLDQRPDVKFEVDDGRSCLTRLERCFDVIQMSFVDTVAATAAGAYAFTENGLYTVEAWRLFLRRLKPGGVLSVSQYYFGDALIINRCLALAAATLRSLGVADPQNHILLVRDRVDRSATRIATMLVSSSPFQSQDVARVQLACTQLQCEVAFGPGVCLDKHFSLLAKGAPADFPKYFPRDVSPTYDDRPYFFYNESSPEPRFVGLPELPWARTLRTLTLLVAALSALLIFVPIVWLKLRGGRDFSGGSRLLPFYFAFIGLAFMLIEIGLMQRMSLFLGHPTYGFTVVLFAMLFASGLGSLASARLSSLFHFRRRWMLLAGAVVVMVCVDVASLALIEHWAASMTSVRIALAFAVLFPLGFVLGMGFPLGMDVVHEHQDQRAAWCWAINGAMSVVGSVVAIITSISYGIRATILAGVLTYLAATLILAVCARTRRSLVQLAGTVTRVTE